MSILTRAKCSFKVLSAIPISLVLGLESADIVLDLIDVSGHGIHWIVEQGRSIGWEKGESRKSSQQKLVMKRPRKTTNEAR